MPSRQYRHPTSAEFEGRHKSTSRARDFELQATPGYCSEVSLAWFPTFGYRRRNARCTRQAQFSCAFMTERDGRPSRDWGFLIISALESRCHLPNGPSDDGHGKYVSIFGLGDAWWRLHIHKVSRNETNLKLSSFIFCSLLSSHPSDIWRPVQCKDAGQWREHCWRSPNRDYCLDVALRDRHYAVSSVRETLSRRCGYLQNAGERFSAKVWAWPLISPTLTHRLLWTGKLFVLPSW